MLCRYEHKYGDVEHVPSSSIKARAVRAVPPCACAGFLGKGRAPSALSAVYVLAARPHQVGRTGRVAGRPRPAQHAQARGVGVHPIRCTLPHTLNRR